MPLIAMKDASFGFGGPLLLEEMNFQISPGERVCLLGRNGSGKSTFLRILREELKIVAGEINRQPNLRIGMLEQSVPQQTTGSVFNVVAEGLGDAGRLLVEYHSIDHEKTTGHGVDEEKMQKLHNELDRTDAWKKLRVVETAISQVSLNADAEFSQLSAGLKRRVLLARALAAEPDILVLDEPTNHLDVDAISWMEDFLLRYSKTLLFVTHDRKFLKKLATRILEIDRGRLSSWDCSYDEYLKRKEQLLAAEQIQWEHFDKKLAEEERWIRKGIQARRTRNEGRVRALKKMRLQRSQRKNLEGIARIEINKAVRSGELVVKAINAGFSYNKDEQAIISGLNTSVMRGDRVGIIGPNGMGKTTLLKLLLGEIAPTTGSVKLGTNVECAYFDQLGGQLELDKSLAENIGHGYDTIVINGRRKQIVAYLMDFMFTPSKSTSPAFNLSGGERNRLQIARIFTQPSNLLVLDEPTNDLDVETLELLEEMLIQYTGTVLIVSHDREFINNVVTSTLVLEGQGVVKEYAGGYDDWIIQRKKNEDAEKEAAAKDRPERVKRPKPAKLTYSQNQEMQKLPGIVEKLEKQILILHEQMADASFYKQDGVIIAKAKSDLEKFSIGLSAAYKRWEELMDVE